MPADPAPLRPARPRLADALACVLRVTIAELRDVHRVFGGGADLAAWALPRAAITDPREAWEALCTTLDLYDWVGDARRGFGCPDCRRSAAGEREVFGQYGWYERHDCDTCDGADSLPHPPTVAACVALASDPEGVLTAEALAREAAARVAPIDPPHRVVWRVVPAGELAGRAQPDWARAPAGLDLARHGYAIERVGLDVITLLCPES